MKRMFSSSRDTRIRHQLSPDPHALYYPFSYLDEFDLTPHVMIGECVEAKVEDFPLCITHYYWIHQGINDEVPWRALFQDRDKLRNILRYGFYLGECDYTGFDCQGSMRLFVSDHIDILIEKALTDADYVLYIRETDYKA